MHNMFENNSSLSYAILNNNFAKVKQLIEEGKDPNALDEQTQMRPIFLAARKCNWKIFQYLLLQGASISSQGNNQLQNNLLFCICACCGNFERARLLLWLREENRYEQCELGIQKEHMAAALGEPPQKRNLGKRDKSGFLPSHYAAMVDSEYFLAWCSETGELEEDDQESQGITVSWILGINKQYGDLFKYADHCQAINFNSAPFSDLYLKIIKNNVFDYIQQKSMTLAWQLVEDEMANYLEDYLDKKPLTKIKLEADYYHDIEGCRLSIITILSSLNRNGSTESLLEKIFRVYSEEEIKQLANFFLAKQEEDFYSRSTVYNVPDYCQLALARKSYQELYQRLSVQIQEKSSEKEIEKSLSENNEILLSKEEIQNYFNKIFNYLHSIKPNSPHYFQAQSMIGNIISSHIQEAVLQPLLWAALASHVETTLNYPTKIKNRLRLYMIFCFNRGDEKSKVLAIQLREVFYEENQQPNQENKQLKRQIQELKRKLPSSDEEKTSDISEVVEGKNETPENSAVAQLTGLPSSNTLDAELEQTVSHEPKIILSEETFKALFELIEFDELQALKELLEKDNIKPDIKIAGEVEAFIINIAAIKGSFAIIQYLFAIKAFPTEPVRVFDNFLFATCMCKDEEKRQAVLQWLLEDNRHEQFNLGLQKEHIEAALGKLPPEGYVAKRDRNGLLPCHYAAMVGSKNLLAWCSESGEVEEDGRLTHDIRVSLLLAKGGYFELLASYLQKYLTNIDPNATCLEFPFQGESLLLLIANAQEWELFDALAEYYAETIDWNATALSGPLAGLNVFWLLAFFEQWASLNKWVNYARTINWDAAPVNGFKCPLFIRKKNRPTINDFYYVFDEHAIFFDDDENSVADGIDEINIEPIEINENSEINLNRADKYYMDYDYSRPFQKFYNREYRKLYKAIIYKNVTLGWLSIMGEQFNIIIENLRRGRDATINLSIGPVDEMNRLVGVIALRHLIDLSQWSLLYICLERESFIDLKILLSEQPSALRAFSDSFILDRLIAERQYSLVILIIRSLDEEKIQELADFYRERRLDDNDSDSILYRGHSDIIVDACQLALAIKCYEKLLQCVTIPDQNVTKEKEKTLDKNESNQLTEKDKKIYLTDIFERLHNIERDSIYYRQAQSLIGHIIFSYLGEPELLWSVLEVRIKKGYELTNNYTFTESTTIETQLRLYMEICLDKGDDESKGLVVQLIAEMFERCEKFLKENAALQLEIEELENLVASKVRPLPSLNSVDSALLWQPVPSTMLDQNQSPQLQATNLNNTKNM